MLFDPGRDFRGTGEYQGTSLKDARGAALADDFSMLRNQSPEMGVRNLMSIYEYYQLNFKMIYEIINCCGVSFRNTKQSRHARRQ